MRITSCGVTDVGLKRGHNEDNFLINEELHLFVVADGMGGHVGGEYASAIAVNTVEEIVTSMELHEELPHEEDDPVEVTREKLRYAIRLAGRRIFEKAEEEPEFHGMGTTSVALLVDEGNAYIAHVGDSRLYMQRDGQIEQVTEDHSLVNEKVKAGLITKEEAKNHKMRNVITRSLGYQEDVEVDVEVRAVRRGDQFLICSDGLSGLVEDHEMGEHMTAHSPQEAARRLVELACERGGDDNITIIITRVDEVP
ncbi:MAG: Stp1/IreP family PP2C-type Ser/Thr phosphatase [Deltaproteobacteria bacterium]|nr:Stp1/IreP family PP2C-type Ser/Thr phosphatase [Deltaproteobacteria bacterium]